jgi:hypothetical protein
VLSWLGSELSEIPVGFPAEGGMRVEVHPTHDIARQGGDQESAIIMIATRFIRGM